MYIYLYKITNLINNKEYIGIHSSNSLSDNYYGSGTLIRNAIKKYGKINFKKEIIMLADSWEEALELEKIAVNPEYVNSRKTYNIREGGNGSEGLFGKDNPFYGKTHSEETRKKLKEIISSERGGMCGENNPFHGKKHSEKTKEILRKKNIGKQNDCRRKGWWITPYGRFRTHREATKVSGVQSRNRCKNPDKIAYPVSKYNGKTWRELGWYFEFFEQN